MKTDTPPLTPREREVLEHISMGKTSKHVAADLGISENTVEVHRKNIYSKLNVHSVVELLRTIFL